MKIEKITEVIRETRGRQTIIRLRDTVKDDVMKIDLIEGKLVNQPTIRNGTGKEH